MKGLGLSIALAAGTILAVSPLFAQKNEQQGQGRAVVTILPAQKNGDVGRISAQSLRVKVDGKESSVLNFTQLQDTNSPVELVVLLDSGAQTSLGTQFQDIRKFVGEMPANTRMAIAYMENGRATFASP